MGDELGCARAAAAAVLYLDPEVDLGTGQGFAGSPADPGYGEIGSATRTRDTRKDDKARYDDQ